MQTKENEQELEYSSKMQEAFHIEELEDRFEMAPINDIPLPNGACWLS